jgi:hypothetical protein
MTSITITRADTYYEAAKALSDSVDNLNKSRSDYIVSFYALSEDKAEQAYQVARRVLADKKREVEALEKALEDYSVQVNLGGPEALMEKLSD